MELKPCPFCGGDGHLYQRLWHGSDKQWEVFCFNENCIGHSITAIFKTKELATKAWNRRAENGD